MKTCATTNTFITNKWVGPVDCNLLSPWSWGVSSFLSSSLSYCLLVRRSLPVPGETLPSETFNKVGILDENILVLTPNVELELTCKNKCIQNDNCSFYTYFHGNDSPYHETCVLLTEILPPIQDCDTCVTGPVDCSSNKQQCFLAINGEFYQSLKVTNTSGSQNLTVIGPMGLPLVNWESWQSGAEEKMLELAVPGRVTFNIVLCFWTLGQL